jgi:hypothetical protein
MYTAGHNVVVYNTEDKSQYFLAGNHHYRFNMSIGSEGTEGITCISVSPGKKYLAICEKADKAKCRILDI